jgi:hypothetical protein
MSYEFNKIEIDRYERHGVLSIHLENFNFPRPLHSIRDIRNVTNGINMDLSELYFFSAPTKAWISSNKTKSHNSKKNSKRRLIIMSKESKQEIPKSARILEIENPNLELRLKNVGHEGKWGKGITYELK